MGKLIKTINAIKIGFTCAKIFWKNPANLVDAKLEFANQISDLIDKTAHEKMNTCSHFATVYKDLGNELVKVSIWGGVYDCETAHDSPFERITSFHNRRDSLIEMYKKERDELIRMLRLYEQEEYESYTLEKYQSRVHSLNEFIAQLKMIK